MNHVSQLQLELLFFPATRLRPISLSGIQDGNTELLQGTPNPVRFPAREIMVG